MRKQRGGFAGLLVARVTITSRLGLSLGFILIVYIGDLVKAVIDCLAFRKPSQESPSNDFTCICSRFPQSAVF